MKWLGLALPLVMASMLLGCVPPGPSLELCQKPDCETHVFECAVDGPSATLSYSASGPEFSFTVVGTAPLASTDYSLIYAPDPWPQSGLICLGHTTSGAAGEINLTGSKMIGEDLPVCNTNVCDDNYPTGAKIWLVKKTDVDCNNKVMKSYFGEPDQGCTTWLFENDLITYTYVSGEAP